MINYVFQFNSAAQAQADAVVGPYWTGSKWRDDLCLLPTISISGSQLFGLTLLIASSSPNSALLNHGNCIFAFDRDLAASGGAFVKKTGWLGENLPNFTFKPLHAGDKTMAQITASPVGGSLAARQAWKATAMQSGAETQAAAYVARGLGLFMHFNMSTFTGAIGNNQSANVSESLFDPGSTLNIDQWVTSAQAMKANYAMLTAKHHDGFCLWPTATTVHSIANSSWYASHGNTDVLGQYVSKFRAAGIAPGIYWSVWDKRLEFENPTVTQAQYKTYLQAQLTELLGGNYGTIPAIWMDGTYWNFGSYYPWASAAERNAFIRGLQPNIVIVDNNHQHDWTSCDIDEAEATLPSLNMFNGEMCDTIMTDGSWFWNSTSIASLKTSASLLSNLTTCGARNASYLLNCPPDNTGVIPSAVVTLMTAIGSGH